MVTLERAQDHETDWQQELAALRQLADQRLQSIDELKNLLRVRTDELDRLREQQSWYFNLGWFLRQRLKRLIGMNLTTRPQYRARPVRLPRDYDRPPVLDALPRISIVTPSYNQAEFLERTIRSVLDQGYANLEYIVQDGASTDETPQVLARHAHELKHWESVPDRGQAHAINQGFRHASGDILAYLNSDDVLLPGALHYVAAYFASHPEVDVVYGHRVVIDEVDREIGRWVLPRHKDGVLSWADYVPQETLFWRRTIWDKVGAAMDESFQFALDWDLLLRFRDAGANMVRLPRFLGAFRVHPAQKTVSEMATHGAQEMHRLRQRCHGRKVSYPEIARNLAGFIGRHMVCHFLYKCRLLRY